MNLSRISRLFFTFVLLFGLKFSVLADEGMWMLNTLKSLNEADMKKLGLELSAEDIYSINQSSLKDAIVSLGGFCTAEMISPEGLMLTNHHCAFDAIQSHSTVENDYLTDGFWAMSKDQELPVPGLTASFLVRIDNVTDAVLGELKMNMSEEERERAVYAIGDSLIAGMEENEKYDIRFKSTFAGNEYYLFIYQTFRDVRLVGAPPSAIGKFGGDTDNWMWPRHTGDFAMLRVYSGKDGEPADYAKENIPYKPKHFLPISLDGVQQDDFSMILGFPGHTERYLSSHGVQMTLEIDIPSIVSIREQRLRLMKEQMNASDEVRIKYASKYAQVSNYYKYYKGQKRGLKRLKVYDKKKKLEDKFQKWAKTKASSNTAYAKALQMLEEGYREKATYRKSQLYFNEAGFGSEIITLSYFFNRLKNALDQEASKEEINQQVEALKARIQGHFKDYDAKTDEAVSKALLTMYYNNTERSQQPDIFRTIESKYKGDAGKFVERMFEKSIFASQASLNAFLEDPKAKTLEKDLAFQTMESILTNYRTNLRAGLLGAQDKIDAGYRHFIRGLREMQPNKKYYPDANSTLRLTYGQVKDYYPADAVYYNYYTTVAGVMEKEDPSNDEFIVPDKLKALVMNKDFGRYGENGTLNVCFTTNNDITGGNSGSPVINGKGELIGLAFDGNWEAMSGDIAFEPELQRTIAVDIRYVLFVVDKFAKAQNLIDELTLVERKSDLQSEAKEKTPEMAPVN